MPSQRKREGRVFLVGRYVAGSKLRQLFMQPLPAAVCVVYVCLYMVLLEGMKQDHQNHQKNYK